MALRWALPSYRGLLAIALLSLARRRYWMRLQMKPKVSLSFKQTTVAAA